MIGPKTTAGYHLAELNRMSTIAAEYNIALPEWANTYHRILLAAVKRGYIRG